MREGGEKSNPQREKDIRDKLKALSNGLEEIEEKVSNLRQEIRGLKNRLKGVLEDLQREELSPEVSEEEVPQEQATTSIEKGAEREAVPQEAGPRNLLLVFLITPIYLLFGCSFLILASCFLGFFWDTLKSEVFNLNFSLSNPNLATALLFPTLVLVSLLPSLLYRITSLGFLREKERVKENLLAGLGYLGALITSGGILLIAQSLFFKGPQTQALSLLIIFFGGLVLSALGILSFSVLKLRGPGGLLLATGLAFLFITVITGNLLKFISPISFLLSFILLIGISMAVSYITSSGLIVIVPSAFTLLALLSAPNLGYIIFLSYLILLLPLGTYRYWRDKIFHVDLLIPLITSISGILIVLGLRFFSSEIHWALFSAELSLLGTLGSLLIWLTNLSRRVKLSLFSLLAISLAFALGNASYSFYPLLFSLPILAPLAIELKDGRSPRDLAFPVIILLIATLTRGLELSDWVIWGLQSALFSLLLLSDEVTWKEIALSLAIVVVALLGYLTGPEGGTGFIRSKALFFLFSLLGGVYVTYQFWSSPYFKNLWIWFPLTGFWLWAINESSALGKSLSVTAPNLQGLAYGSSTLMIGLLGALLIYLGLQKEEKVILWAGILSELLMLVKLLTYDLSMIEAEYRGMIGVVLGLTFLVLTFIWYRRRETGRIKGEKGEKEV